MLVDLTSLELLVDSIRDDGTIEVRTLRQRIISMKLTRTNLMGIVKYFVIENMFLAQPNLIEPNLSLA